MSTTEKQALAGVSISDAALATNDRAWKKAVECLNYGMSDVQAIPEVYNLLTAPATVTDVAAIIGAIYANNYWRNVQMSVDALASALLQTRLWTQPACTQAAQAAFKTWRGLWVRANPAMVPLGGIPKTGAQMQSPDVGCTGQQPLTRPVLLQNWNQVFTGPAAVGRNFASARAQSANLPVPITDPRVRVYWVPTAVSVPPPEDWKEMAQGAPDADVLMGVNPGPIPDRGRAASGPMVFEAPGAGHYCVTALASTEFFSNPLPSGNTGNWNLTTWLQYNGAAAWVNLNVTGFVQAAPLAFYNHDARQERFEFEVRSQGLARGTVVSVEADEPKVSASGSVTEHSHVLRSGVVTVPARFKGELRVTVSTPDGGPLPAGATVDVQTAWLVGDGHPHHADALAAPYAVTGDDGDARVYTGSFTFLGPQR